MLPTSGAAPVRRTPYRSVPLAKSPSSSPSLSVSRSVVEVMSSVIPMAPPMVMSAVLPPLISTPVAPFAALTIPIELPESMSKSWLEFTVTATPLVRLMAPADARRMLSGPDPVAFAVVIGVVRAVEITTSAIAPDAAIRGAIATAVASRIRIRWKPLWTVRAETPAIL